MPDILKETIQSVMSGKGNKLRLVGLLKSENFIQPRKDNEITLIINSLGERYIMVFTSVDEMKKWNDQEYQEIKFYEIVKQLTEHNDIAGIAINPYTDNCILNKDKFIAK